MSLDGYKRNIYPYAIDLMAQYPVLAIIGARQVGKTTLAKALAKDFMYLDLEKSSDYDRISHDPEFFFKQYPDNIIFDEAQVFPDLFPTLRGIIDEQRQSNGRFIITGSSSPELLENISESLAGRIAIIELGTLKANEFYHQPLSDFYDLFQQPLKKDQEIVINTPLRSIQQIQKFWLLGGYPEPISKETKAYQDWMVDYQATYLNRDIAKLFPKLDKISYRRFLTILGKLSNKLINKSDIGRAIAVSEPTVSKYLDIANGTFLWRQLPSYEKSATKSIVKMPKGHLRDSGLLHHLLHINTLESLQSDPIAGFSFEGFVIEEILKGLQDARIRNLDSYYYRTRSGMEVDLILEGPFGIVPIEIKYGYKVIRQQLNSLTAFVENNRCAFGIVINQSDRIEWLTKNIVQIPAGYL